MGVRKGVEPQDSVGNEPDNNQPGETAEWEQRVGTAGPVFNGPDSAFYVGYMFAGAAGVEEREKFPEGFKFLIP
jgi:hypothetical protein